jgi:hypothetical protein
MDKEVASEETKYEVHPVNMKGLESRIWWSQLEASQFAWWSLTTRNHDSTSITERKIAAVMPDHWNPTADNETCSTNTLNSARFEALGSNRLCQCGSFPARGHYKWPNRVCRVFASLIGFKSKWLDSIPHWRCVVYGYTAFEVRLKVKIRQPARKVNINWLIWRTQFKSLMTKLHSVH